MLKAHRFGWRRLPSKAQGPFKTIIKNCIALQRTKQRKDPNLDFPNFFKRDDMTNLAYRQAWTPRLRRGMTKALLGTISRID